MGGDVEMRSMLKWYVRVAGGPPFNEHQEYVALTAVVEAAEASEEEVLLWRPSVTDYRGQMGRYWRSLRDDA
jgi:hypothetical protein